MIQAKFLTVTVVACITLTACGGEDVQQAATGVEANLEETVADVKVEPTKEDIKAAGTKPGAPYRISYQIIGTPIVGSPVTVEMQIGSLVGSRPLTLDYRIRDASSMMLAESQPARVRMEPAANEMMFKQQVTLIPQREGRFYLNVSASFETENGTMSTVTAIPIQVGAGTRELQEHGEVQVDENGEAVRVLTSE
jgi:hypothetical protein